MSIQPSPFPIRVAPLIMELVKKEAEIQGRSVNKQIEIWLKEKTEKLTYES
jgi:hypothetical protein